MGRRAWLSEQCQQEFSQCCQLPYECAWRLRQPSTPLCCTPRLCGPSCLAPCIVLWQRTMCPRLGKRSIGSGHPSDPDDHWGATRSYSTLVVLSPFWRCAWHGCASFHALCWAKYLGGLCFAAAGQDWREAVADDLSDHHATLSTKLTELPAPLQNLQPWRELVKAHPKPWKQILVAEQESLQQMGLRMDSSNGENQDLDE